MILLTLRQLKEEIWEMEEQSREVRVFTTCEKAKEWLSSNNFFYGRRSFFKYNDDSMEWCHMNDKSWEYIDVQIEELEADNMSDSLFLDWTASPAPWFY